MCLTLLWDLGLTFYQGQGSHDEIRARMSDSDKAMKRSNGGKGGGEDKAGGGRRSWEVLKLWRWESPGTGCPGGPGLHVVTAMNRDVPWDGRPKGRERWRRSPLLVEEQGRGAARSYGSTPLSSPYFHCSLSAKGIINTFTNNKRRRKRTCPFFSRTLHSCQTNV